MQKTPSVQLDTPIQSAVVLGAHGADSDGPADLLAQRAPGQKTQTAEMCSNLQKIVTTLSQTQGELFCRYKEDIINLAVEIARRIIAYKIEQGDYQIQEIIRQVLNDAPVKNDIVIRLNPGDWNRIEQLTRAHEIDFAQGVTFVADPKIAAAQCLLETPKGIIESFVDEHLDRISEALRKTG
jgi:flagellar biosynthesis/type III secretory pathway protein FliH